MTDAVTVDGAATRGSASSPPWSPRTRSFLTELDAAIGDADHGINMDRGMTAVVAALDESRRPAPAALFKQVGMTLVSTVGGGQRAALRHVLPPARRRAGDAAELDPRGSRPRCGPGWTAWWPAARPRPATRRCTTRSHRRSRRWTTSAPPTATCRRGVGAAAARRRPDATRRRRCSPARAGPATSASAAAPGPPGPRRHQRRRCC